jgi:CBS-domain-containing membrane protein
LAGDRGNIVSAQAGVVAFNVIPNTEAAAGVAVGLAILAECFDIGREDLDALLTRAELHARARQG